MPKPKEGEKAQAKGGGEGAKREVERQKEQLEKEA